MIAPAAAKKLARPVSVTETDCDVKSDSVRAVNVTLRLAATPDEKSSVPKNNTSMIGTIIANSIAATPQQSLTRPSVRCRAWRHVFRIDFNAGVMLGTIRFYE